MIFRRRDSRPFIERARDFVYPRRGWRRAIEYMGHRVKRIPDTPHRIALGFACGAFASFSPFFGLHFFYAMGLAWILRSNIVASLIGTAVGNPLTFPFIASISMALGRRILGYGGTGRDFGRIVSAFRQFFDGLREGVLSLFGYGAPDWHKMQAFLQDVILPYFVGGLLPGLAVATIAYFIVRPLIMAYQAARRIRLANRGKALAETNASRKTEADVAE